MTISSAKKTVKNYIKYEYENLTVINNLATINNGVLMRNIIVKCLDLTPLVIINTIFFVWIFFLN